MRSLLVHFYQDTEIPLDGHFFLQHIKYCPPFGVIPKLTEGTLHLVVLPVSERS